MQEVSGWLREENSPWDAQLHRVERVVFEKQTQYQHARIIDTGFYGRKFFLDGDLQSATLDEFIYHESLTHPALLAFGAPVRVLILGGGEGATLREVLRWRTVRVARMVDIDREVIAACKTHLGAMHQGAFDDARSSVTIADASAYLSAAAAAGERWDVIISDITSPTEAGPANFCFTQDYFEAAHAVLSTEGVLVTQSGPIAPRLIDLHARATRTVARVFAHVASYGCAVASFGQNWGFTIASDVPLTPRLGAARTSELLSTHVTGPLRFLDGPFVAALLTPPVYVRTAIASENSIFTREDLPMRISSGSTSAPDP
jgi:spermidine synthase